MSENAVVDETIDDSVDAIQQTVGEQEFSVDAETDDLDRQEFGRELGSQIGREVGGIVGRGLGNLIVTSARERDDSSDVIEDVREYLVTVTREVLQHAAVEASFSEVKQLVTEAAPTEAFEDAGDTVSDAVDEARDTADDATDEAKDAADDANDVASDAASNAQDTAEDAADEAGDKASDTAEQASDAADEAADDASDAASTENLSSLREGALRDLLDVMSYEDLQSIAKEIDVKANLDRETMTEEIVEHFADGEQRSE